MNQTVEALIERIGLADTIEIVRRWGGRRLCVPDRCTHDCALALCLGLPAAQALVDNFRGERLDLPIERNALIGLRNRKIIAEIEAGDSQTAVAHRYGITRPMVNKILRNHRAAAELCDR